MNSCPKTTYHRAKTRSQKPIHRSWREYPYGRKTYTKFPVHQATIIVILHNTKTQTFNLYAYKGYYAPRLGRFTQEDVHWNEGNNIYDGNPGENPMPSLTAIMQSGNLYVYCSNNPIIYKDENGKFLHLIIGAGIGAGIGFAASIIEQKLSGNEIDWGKAGRAAGAGAISGLVASTGVGLVAQIAVGAGVAAGENVVNQVIDNKGFDNFDPLSTLSAGIGGAAGGFIGGKGVDGKMLINSAKKLDQQILKQIPKIEGATTKGPIKKLDRFVTARTEINKTFATGVARYSGGVAAGKSAAGFISGH